MRKVILPLLLTLIIIGFSSKIRSLGEYDTTPKKVLDEVNYVWQGISIRQNGIPAAWSDASGYFKHIGQTIPYSNVDGFAIRTGDKKLTWQTRNELDLPLFAISEGDLGEGQKQYLIVSPFFDHPPLGGLIYSLGISENTKNFLDVKAHEYRKISLNAAVITSILLFIFIFLITKNAWIGLIAVAIYSTVPTYLISSRFALLENMIPPFALLHLILLIISNDLKEKGNKWAYPLLLVSAFVGGLIFLVKESGVGFIIASFLILTLVWHYPFKKVVSFTALALLPVASYFIWGLWIAPQVFIEVFLSNAGRKFFGSLNFLSMLPSLRFENFPLDGWWVFGFISILFLKLKANTGYLLLILPFAGHFSTVLIFGSLNYPWYYLGLAPFLATFSALVLWKILTAPGWKMLAVFFLLPLSSSLYWGYYTTHQLPDVGLYRLLFVVFFIFSALICLKGDNAVVKKIWLLFCIALFIALLKLNINSVYYLLANWTSWIRLLPNSSLPGL